MSLRYLASVPAGFWRGLASDRPGARKCRGRGSASASRTYQRRSSVEQPGMLLGRVARCRAEAEPVRRPVRRQDKGIRRAFVNPASRYGKAQVTRLPRHETAALVRAAPLGLVSGRLP